MRPKCSRWEREQPREWILHDKRVRIGVKGDDRLRALKTAIAIAGTLLLGGCLVIMLFLLGN